MINNKIHYMKGKMKLLVAMLLMLAGFKIYAHDFVVTINDQKVYFNITSNKNKTAEVTFYGDAVNKEPSYFEGELNIPAKVRHNDVVYAITGVGAKAFCDADKLTGVVLPLGVTYIGDFAFEGCTSLSRIIFPGNAVKFGQGVFFKCDKIQYVSFGSEWNTVDLEMFRWSDSITNIVIPAKMDKIKNVKSLKKLETISVDANNTKFSTDNGVLYSNDFKTLYSCPRAFQGELVINKNTKYIINGALYNCNDVTLIDIPESIESFSYREFSKMEKLSKIIFRKSEPVMTALSNGEQVFVLEVANPDVIITIEKKARENYRSLIQQAGEYSDLDGKNANHVDLDNMPDVKNIKTVKSFLNN